MAQFRSDADRDAWVAFAAAAIAGRYGEMGVARWAAWAKVADEMLAELKRREVER
jgi:hypothetical protein